MSNVVTFPAIPRQAQQAPKFVIPVPIVDNAADTEKARQIKMVRDALDHAVRKLLVVAECNGESAWAIRLLESHAAAAKSEYGVKDGGDGAL
jgi:hypothetical protein